MPAERFARIRTQRPRADHQVRALLCDGPDQRFHLFRVVAVVSIQENDLDIWTQSLDPSEACGSISPLRLAQYRSAQRLCQARRAIGAAVVHDNHFVRNVSRNISENQPNGLLFIENGKDHRHATTALFESVIAASHGLVPGAWVSSEFSDQS